MTVLHDIVFDQEHADSSLLNPEHFFNDELSGSENHLYKRFAFNKHYVFPKETPNNRCNVLIIHYDRNEKKLYIDLEGYMDPGTNKIGTNFITMACCDLSGDKPVMVYGDNSENNGLYFLDEPINLKYMYLWDKATDTKTYGIDIGDEFIRTIADIDAAIGL